MLSFMGPQHDRILHSYFDQNYISLKYSKLFSFERKETALVELFLQYVLSNSVNGTVFEESSKDRPSKKARKL